MSADNFERVICGFFIFLVFTSLAWAQQDGEQVFGKSCATGYCHGPKGTAGGAPRLAARGFDQAFIASVVNRGVPGTAMQGFANTLSRPELAAVIAYVASLNGVSNSTAPAAAPVAVSGEAARGRELFSDAVRSFGRCSTCHEVNGIGIPVAVPIANVPANVQELRAIAPKVSTAALDGQTMPALVVSNGMRSVIFYDLTTPPPVLRTADPAAVKLTDGSSWRHSSVIGSYKDDELGSILTYLRAVLNAG
ncbi:MAG TPA: c-type cytochrome [Terriglobia bacterium]|nr:c-type cytochrome [Terriglobia bacterium]